MTYILPTIIVTLAAIGLLSNFFFIFFYGLTRGGKQWSLRFINNINSVTNSKNEHTNGWFTI